MRDTELRPMSIDDYEQVIALWQSVEGVGLDDDDSQRGIGAYLDRNPGLSFVATCDAKIVGAVLCGHDGRRGYLHHLAVSPDHRGRGIGRELTNACLAGLRALGIAKCNIMVFEDNDHGLEFWERCRWITRHDLLLLQMPLPTR